MKCPSCGTTIKDRDAKFCPRCGVSLESAEFEVTDSIGVPVEGATEGSGTTEIESDPVEHEDESTASSAEPRPEGTTDLRARVTRAGWIEAVEGAALAFLFMLCVAALLVLALRLQGIGSEGNIIEILSVIVLFALGILGIPVRLGGMAISLVPLGALLIVGVGIVWAVRVALARRDSLGMRGRVIDGIKAGLCFGVLCFVAALMFRISGKTPISANPWIALVFGCAWGALFGALAGWSMPLSPWARVKALLATAGLTGVRSGILGGSVALAICALLGVLVVLLWIIGALIAGPPRDLGASDAFAGLLYLSAFLPNIVVAVVCLGLGAPLAVGAQISTGGRLIGPLREYSIFGWVGGDAPWYAAALILIPAIGCFAAGIYAQTRGRPESRTRTILIMAGTFAVALFMLSLLGEARLGPGLLRARGFAKMSPHPWWTLLLAFSWATVLGHVGWRVSETRTPAPDPEEGS